MKKHKYFSVSIELTSPKENMTDLLNLFAEMGFASGMSSKDVERMAKTIIQEKYFQTIVSLGQHEI